jgi:hypothetical protein
MTTINSDAQPVMSDVRVRAFVDFWNFQLAIRREIGDVFRVDWSRLGPWLAQKAGGLTLDPSHHGRVRYEGLNVYLSYSPSSSKDAKLLHWAVNVLDRFPGVHVVEKEARPKNPPNCPACHTQVDVCPHCGSGMSGTVEKGIDTAIVTDMIKLAWENSYDVAVLVSNDRDFIPAVEFLASKGRKVINAAFPPSGMELARRCWASFDLRKEGIPSLVAAVAPVVEPPAVPSEAATTTRG